MTSYNTLLAFLPSKQSQIEPLSIQSALRSAHKPLYTAIFSAPVEGVGNQNGVRPGMLQRLREQAYNTDSHFHGSFWSKIAFQDILESPSGADVHG